MKSLWQARILFVVLMASLCVCFSAQALAGAHAYPELEPKIATDVSEILIKHGMSVRHDRPNNWFYIAGGYTRWIGGSPSYTLYFYQAEEVPLAAQVEIIDYCLKLYESYGHQVEIRIEMRHEAYKPRFFLPNTYFEMSMKSNQP